MTIFKTVLTAWILTLATLANVVEAGAPASGGSIQNVGCLIDSHKPVLERGDADLWSSSFNMTRYEFFVQHKVVDSGSWSAPSGAQPRRAGRPRGFVFRPAAR